MPITALILLDDVPAGERSPLSLKLAGQSILERLVRQCVAAGATQAIIFATNASAEIAAEAERMANSGLPISVCRSQKELGQKLHPEEAVWVIDGPLLIDQRWFERLANAAHPLLLTVPKAAGDRFERIDAADNWAGLARVSGTIVRETLSQLGDWALGPTILRRIVQLGAERLAIDCDAETAPVIRPLNEQEFTTSRLGQISEKAHGSEKALVANALRKWFLLPFGRQILASNISSKIFHIASIILIILALMLQFSKMPLQSGLLLILAFILAQAGQIVARSLTGEGYPRILGYIRDASVIALAFALVVPIPQGPAKIASFVLASWMCVQWGLHFIFRQNETLLDAEALVLVLLLSGLFGVIPLGLCLCIAALLAEQIWVEIGRQGSRRHGR